MGDVKFCFPNPHMIFLHHTPDPEAFEDKQRVITFGCVRVEKPSELAELLLNDPGRWNQQRILDVVRTRRPLVVRLPQSMPIMLVYMTVLVESGGHLFSEKTSTTATRRCSGC